MPALPWDLALFCPLKAPGSFQAHHTARFSQLIFDLAQENLQRADARAFGQLVSAVGREAC